MQTTEVEKKVKFDPYVNLGNFTPQSNGSIQFNHTRSKKPLPALIEANRNKEGSGINISVVVFIIEEFKNPTINVTQSYSISSAGTKQLQFFITYNYKEVESCNFKSYELNFDAKQEKLPEGVKLGQVDTVEVFLIDKDPIASRGTETSVQSGT
ncbi:hypothetical protein [Flavobacterium sp. PL002]|uniref:hypothetical protein n=1 Tax=Flavobacterium sp. PL002 TaxID=1897058 RepID=UPI0017888601|nr:hypothetical protein [Flavobacterium sp. PL002]MBE0391993.1 hypothetical protein [Flavobacterium sp. PL002]